MGTLYWSPSPRDTYKLTRVQVNVSSSFCIPLELMLGRTTGSMGDILEPAHQSPNGRIPEWHHLSAKASRVYKAWGLARLHRSDYSMEPMHARTQTTSSKDYVGEFPFGVFGLKVQSVYGPESLIRGYSEC